MDIADDNVGSLTHVVNGFRRHLTYHMPPPLSFLSLHCFAMTTDYLHKKTQSTMEQNGIGKNLPSPRHPEWALGPAEPREWRCVSDSQRAFILWLCSKPDERECIQMGTDPRRPYPQLQPLLPFINCGEDANFK